MLEHIWIVQFYPYTCPYCINIYIYCVYIHTCVVELILQFYLTRMQKYIQKKRNPISHCPFQDFILLNFVLLFLLTVQMKKGGNLLIFAGHKVPTRTGFITIPMLIFNKNSKWGSSHKSHFLVQNKNVFFFFLFPLT